MERKIAGHFGSWLWVAVATFMIVGIAGCRNSAPPASPVSLNGLALVADEHTQASGTSKRLGYLADGEAFAFEAGDVFSFAPVQLQHGKTIKSLRCVMKDNTSRGYIQVNLVRGPINTTDPVVGPSQLIANVSTTPAEASPDFIERLATANASLAEIDNTEYGYFFRVDFLDSPGPIGSETVLSLRGCIIEYEE